MSRNFEKWQGDYEKDFYEVKLPDGSTVKCWPNDGKMHALDGSGKQWEPGDIEVRLVQEDSPDFPEGEDKCTFWHQWSKWKDVKTIGIQRGESHVSDVLVQKKVCKKCGEKRYRQEVMWDANKIT